MDVPVVGREGDKLQSVCERDGLVVAGGLGPAGQQRQTAQRAERPHRRPGRECPAAAAREQVKRE